MKKFLLVSLLSTSAQVSAATLIDSIGIEGSSSIPEEALTLNLRANNLEQGKEFDQTNLDIFRQHVIDHYQYFHHQKADVDTEIKQLSNGNVAIHITIREKAIDIQQPSRLADPYDEDMYANPEQEEIEQAAENHEDNGPDGNITLGAGYGSKGANASISFIRRNIFGTDASVRLMGLHDKYETNVDLSYSKPNIFQSNVRFDTNIFYDALDNSRSKSVAEYKRESYGLGARFTLPIDEKNSTYIGARYTQNHLRGLYPEYNRALYLHSIKEDKWHFTTNDIDIVLGWKFDGFNKKFLPTKGWGASLDGTISAPGSDSKYYKFKLNAQGIYPLNEDKTWLIGAKTTLGYAQGIDRNEVPFYQNFFGGGIDSIRGFAYGSIGPRAVYVTNTTPGVSTNPTDYGQLSQRVVGGNALAGASLELTVPSFYVPSEWKNTIRTTLFVDALSVWNTNRHLIHPLANNAGFSKNIRVSSGIAVQWHFPMGVLSVSYAVPLKKQPGDRQERFQLNIGGSF